MTVDNIHTRVHYEYYRKTQSIVLDTDILFLNNKFSEIYSTIIQVHLS